MQDEQPAHPECRCGDAACPQGLAVTAVGQSRPSDTTAVPRDGIDDALFWFLKVLDAVGGDVPAGDGYSVVAAFCDDRGDGDDTCGDAARGCARCRQGGGLYAEGEEAGKAVRGDCSP